MKSRLFLALLMASVEMCLAGTCIAKPDIIADSVAEFSGVQGQNNWYYGFYDGDGTNPFSSNDFELLAQYGGGTYGGGT